MKELTREQVTALEQMIDSTSLAAVMTALEVICDEKCDHLESNWQDPDSGKVWARAATKIAYCNAKLPEGL